MNAISIDHDPACEDESEPPIPGVVGVLGGMGPLATVDFMRKLLDATPASRDQDHVPALVSAIPQIPDRTAAFRGQGASPLHAMVDCARRLKAAGASLLVIPCNTAHLWFDDIASQVALPMLHIVDTALEAALQACTGPLRVGLLATDATVASGLYINRKFAASGEAPVHWMQPTAAETLEWVMPGIEAVKGGRLADGEALLMRAADALTRRGANVLVLGCTEIPLVLNARNVALPTVDATAALARRAVAWSLQQRADALRSP